MNRIALFKASLYLIITIVFLPSFCISSGAEEYSLEDFYDIALENALWNAYGSRWISTIYAPNNQYQVILEVKPEYQMDPSALSMLYVRSSKGQLVPINTL
jgi:hypothetical protein